MNDKNRVSEINEEIKILKEDIERSAKLMANGFSIRHNLGNAAHRAAADRAADRCLGIRKSRLEALEAEKAEITKGWDLMDLFFYA